MAQSLADQFVRLGMPTQLAEVVANAIAASTASLTSADISDFDTAVETAVAAKTEIAALTGSSTAANIVTALQA